MTLDEFEPILVEAVKHQFEQSEFARVSVHAHRIAERLTVLATWRVLRRAYVGDDRFHDLARLNDGQAISVAVTVSASEIERVEYRTPEAIAKTKAWELVDDLRAGLLADIKAGDEREKEAA